MPPASDTRSATRLPARVGRLLRILSHSPHKVVDSFAVRLGARRYGGEVLPLPAHWYHQDPNFGDRLTPWLLIHYGIRAELTPVENSIAFGVGSLHDGIPSDFSGFVLGTGQLNPTRRPLTSAKFVSVRGALSRDNMGAPGGTALGDLGLLSDRVFGRGRTHRKIALVPHRMHRGASWVDRLYAQSERIIIVDVGWNPQRVARVISGSQAVITSSLHGLILADSYGIPAAWGNPAPYTAGREHKFLDHESAVAMSPEPRVANLESASVSDLLRVSKTPDYSHLESLKDELESAIMSLRDHIPGVR